MWLTWRCFGAQNEKKFKDYDQAMSFQQRGLQTHLFTGHGATQDTFEQRDFATTNDMVYDRRLDVNTIITSQKFEGDAGKTRS